MLRFLIICVLFCVAVESVFALVRTPSKQIATELHHILETRSRIDTVSGSLDDVRFRDKYLYEIETFAQKYATSWSTLALRPTIDRSLWYRLRIQDYSLSCEITALRIVLERLAVLVSETDILTSIPQFPQPYSTGGIWGDPDIEFVWYYTGGQTKKTGYGVYEAPLARYAQSYSLRTRIINETSYTGWLSANRHLSELIEILDDPRSHVILWWDWCTDPLYDDGFFPKWGKSILRSFPLPARNRCWRDTSQRTLEWQTPTGKKIVWLSWEHAFVLLGYVGSKKRPSHIIVWDTYTGRHVYTYAEWMRKWSEMQYRSLIISQ